VMLLPVFGYVTTLERKEEYKTGTVNHVELVNILKTGTKEDFKAGMYAHLKPHFDSLKKK
jgi:GntR family transcriptional repressor for pyruvate dehydrogenase complex